MGCLLPLSLQFLKFYLRCESWGLNVKQVMRWWWTFEHWNELGWCIFHCQLLLGTHQPSWLIYKEDQDYGTTHHHPLHHSCCFMNYSWFGGAWNGAGLKLAAVRLRPWIAFHCGGKLPFSFSCHLKFNQMIQFLLIWPTPYTCNTVLVICFPWPF